MADDRPSFGSWLLTQTDRPDPIGDLARDAAQDPEWPKFCDVRQAFNYVYPHRIGTTTSALDDAADLYRQQLPLETDNGGARPPVRRLRSPSLTSRLNKPT
jgi:hypothetical protein